MNDAAVVFVVDNDADVRGSLRTLIESVSLAVKTYASAQEFLDEAEEQPLGCLILDERLPGMSGLQLLEELKRRDIFLPSIVLTGQPDVKFAVRALKVGAFDVLEKPLGDQPVLDLVHEGLARSRRVRDESALRLAARSLLRTLSPREREVLDLLVQGRANKEIADVLALSTRTIEGHRGRLSEKLHVRSLAELVRLAIVAQEPVPIA